ncbi:hypothetical protein [Thioclava sp. DLFJ5-1]|uniref:hypothetical protein n=1 Tax=Thioclava sp. DLFJ5-1 TaxID=1915314 RepID=UPI001FF05174|nr:hypothetical protein [Thioclava sp. DLFJ5-1]
MRFGLAHHGQLVATPKDVNLKLVLYLGQIAVEFTAKIDQQPVVGELKKRLVSILRARRGCDRAEAQIQSLLSWFGKDMVPASGVSRKHWFPALLGAAANFIKLKPKNAGAVPLGGIAYLLGESGFARECAAIR